MAQQLAMQTSRENMNECNYIGTCGLHIFLLNEIKLLVTYHKRNIVWINMLKVVITEKKA